MIGNPETAYTGPHGPWYFWVRVRGEGRRVIAMLTFHYLHFKKPF